MPPRGVKKGTKRARQYEHIKRSERRQGRIGGPRRGDRRAHGEQGTRPQRRVPDRSRTSTQDMSSSRRGGQRSGTNRRKGRTRDQLYNEAKNLDVEGRSRMNKAQLQRAVNRKKG